MICLYTILNRSSAVKSFNTGTSDCVIRNRYILLRYYRRPRIDFFFKRHFLSERTFSLIQKLIGPCPAEANARDQNEARGTRRSHSLCKKYFDKMNNEEETYTRLFILGGKGCSEEQLREAFEVYGNVKNIWIVKDRATNQEKGKPAWRPTRRRWRHLSDVKSSCQVHVSLGISRNGLGRG